MNQLNTHAKIRNLLLALTFAASGLRPAVANDSSNLFESAKKPEK